MNEYPLAFPNVEGDYFILDEKSFLAGIVASRESPRKRIVKPIHRRQEAKVQRMINFLQPGTYIRPHLHPLADASESIVLLKGAIEMLVFNYTGQIESHYQLKAGTINAVFDLEPGVWHSFLVKETDTVLFECKYGPYSKMTDKAFAEWAPAEGTEEASNWLSAHYELIGYKKSL